MDSDIECPYCGSNHILSDYFEEEWTYWCGHCGRDVSAEAYYEECQDADNKRAKELCIPRDEGKQGPDKISRTG